ncbi:MAG: hypothetical protein SF053_17705 [Bacteroidia bacterium]|nr:hypothetical protein [Bacteroidia bacterium]
MESPKQVSKLALNLIERGEWPAINSITLQNGKFWHVRLIRETTLVSAAYCYDEDTLENIYHNSKTYFSSFGKNGSFYFKNFEAFCGEGSYGGDGLVGLIYEGEFLWMAFFDESNPFEHVSMDESFVYAENNHKQIWRFNIHDPTQITISKSSLFSLK